MRLFTVSYPSTDIATDLFTTNATPLCQMLSCPEKYTLYWPESKCPIPVHFNSLTPSISMPSLSISCLMTSNFPIPIPLTFQVANRWGLVQRTPGFSAVESSASARPLGFSDKASFCLPLLHLEVSSSPVEILIPSSLGGPLSSTISGYISFAFIIRFSWQEFSGGLPLPSA